MRVPRDSLVMAVNGAHCVVFRNDGSAQAPRLVLVEAAHRLTPEAASICVDAEGHQVHATLVGGSPFGGGDETDGMEEWRFLLAAAGLLDDLAEQGAPYLILIAPGAALTTILSRMGKAAQRALVATIDGDHASEGADELTALLAARR